MEAEVGTRLASHRYAEKVKTRLASHRYAEKAALSAANSRKRSYLKVLDSSLL